jgi:hypothetical protein
MKSSRFRTRNRSELYHLDSMKRRKQKEKAPAIDDDSLYNSVCIHVGDVQRVELSAMSLGK